MWQVVPLLPRACGRYPGYGHRRLRHLLPKSSSDATSILVAQLPAAFLGDGYTHATAVSAWDAPRHRACALAGETLPRAQTHGVLCNLIVFCIRAGWLALAAWHIMAKHVRSHPPTPRPTPRPTPTDTPTDTDTWLADAVVARCNAW
jgi:hypothetical protein